VASADLGTVLVTGGASGLGAAVCQEVARAGGTPVVLDRRAPADSLPWLEVDLAEGRAAREHAGLDAIVTAAGIDACGRMEDVPGEQWDQVIAVNLLGTAAVVRSALPYLERSRGRVVTVGSTLGLRVLSDATAYCASKFGVVGFTRALAIETAGRIGVTLLIPGGMQTPFFDGRDEKYRPPPDARLAAPADVAAAVVFALQRPSEVELRELVVCPPTESSWP
jgi:NAD(P)-dependent dehydrogenase (short-subunit alcohol dehydrogenase family)